MQKKIKLLFVSYLVILLCTVLIVGGTFSLFTDSVSVKNHLQAGTLDVKLVRTNLEYTKINEEGYLEVIKDNEQYDFTNEVDKNIFGLDSNNLQIIPGSYFSTTLELINNGNVAFEYSIIIILNTEGNELANQLEVEIIDAENNKISKKLSELSNGKELLFKEMNSVLNKEIFNVKITFLDDINNNKAKEQAIDFDLVVNAVQKTNKDISPNN